MMVEESRCHFQDFLDVRQDGSFLMFGNRLSVFLFTDACSNEVTGVAIDQGRSI